MRTAAFALISVIFMASAAAHARPGTVSIGPAARPASLKVPGGYTPKKAWPLIVGLHGLGSNAKELDLHLGLSINARRLGYFAILPDGTKRSDGLRFWNATDWCCDADGTGVDDAGYIRGLVREARARYAIDPERIYVIGFSNGGFMAHRLACENDGLFKGVVSIAGATFLDESRCAAATPTRVLQIHGTDDKTVAYAGKPGKHPGAPRAAELWAERNGCLSRAEAREPFSLAVFPVGRETTETRYTDCREGADAALWTIEGAPHVPLFRRRKLLEAALEFLGAR